jgi:hypothetical protein
MWFIVLRAAMLGPKHGPTFLRRFALLWLIGAAFLLYCLIRP